MGWGVYLPLRGDVFVFGQYGFVSVGAYTAVLSTLAGYPFAVSIFIAAAITTIVAILVGFPSLRVKGVGVAIVTIGFAEIIKVFWSNSGSIFPQAGGIAGVMVPEKSTLSIVLVVTAFLGIMLYRLENSKLGRAIDAIGNDELAAGAMGINLVATKLFLIGASGFLCGIAGALYSHHVGFIEPTSFAFPLLVSMVVYAMLGGLQTVYGAVIGSLVFNFSLEFMGSLIGWRVFIGGAILVLLLLFLPNGILNRRSLPKIEKFFSR